MINLNQDQVRQINLPVKAGVYERIHEIMPSVRQRVYTAQEEGTASRDVTNWVDNTHNKPLSTVLPRKMSLEQVCKKWISAMKSMGLSQVMARTPLSLWITSGLTAEAVSYCMFADLYMKKTEMGAYLTLVRALRLIENRSKGRLIKEMWVHPETKAGPIIWTDTSLRGVRIQDSTLRETCGSKQVIFFPGSRTRRDMFIRYENVCEFFIDEVLFFNMRDNTSQVMDTASVVD